MKKFIIASAAAAVLSTVAVAGVYSSDVNVYGGYNIADTDCVFGIHQLLVLT